VSRRRTHRAATHSMPRHAQGRRVRWSAEREASRAQHEAPDRTDLDPACRIAAANRRADRRPGTHSIARAPGRRRVVRERCARPPPACADVWGGSIVTMVREDHPTIRAINPRRGSGIRTTSTGYSVSRCEPIPGNAPSCWRSSRPCRPRTGSVEGRSRGRASLSSAPCSLKPMQSPGMNGRTSSRSRAS
jgi:hypothetical protein